jgi:hypothetical protein
MKNICAILTIAALSIGSAYAGCGKIDTAEGKVKSFDKDTKTLVVTTKAGAKKVTLTPTSKGSELAVVGKKVTVSSSHGKVTEIASN